MSDPAWSPDARGKTLTRLNSRRVLDNPSRELGPVFNTIPGWAEVDTSTVVTERISGAMTNLVFRSTCPTAEAYPTVIVRLFGPGNSLFSQKEERDVFLLAGQTGIGPRCLVEFEGGRVEEFIPGATLSAATMRAPEIVQLTATALAVFHVRMTAQRAARGAVGANDQPAIFRRIGKWHATATGLAPALLQELGLEDVMDEVAQLRRYHESTFPLWLGFCHNDLQYGNMLLCPGRDASPQGSPAGPAEESATPPGSPRAHIRLIDYEYATLNDVAFDVANHWCEYAADYHSGEAHVLDFAALPGDEQKAAFAEAYADAMLAQAAAGAGRLAERVCAGEVDAGCREHGALARLLVQKAEAYVPLSHLKWGLWGVMQAQTSDVDFDYLEYARQRIAQYHATKTRYL
ncbi:Choline/ethanolamine kinase [Auxenochlorella protothecoides]|uniref:Choline/ethanolamine kinase n=1 Tax=Auxenochlorella protothecoides TaxID=3075 RepID=A0A087SB00_AUXPR|nr:Choline/ethanolamine kinase [Auxenochlorella protothecoides]KFM22904.1 Choline/ethanolamine kinase [Auxenochlorella protothecoides]